MANITLKKAGVEDIPTLLVIGKAVSNPKMYPSFTKEEEWKEELSGGTTYIIERDGNVIGDVGYNKEKDRCVELNGIAIFPQFQGQGIGKEVMGIIMEELKNVKKIKVTTHPENSRAIKLYLSFGFVIKSWKDNYYGDGEPRIELVREK
jgi:ribosomal protein S18 acetylase RimI-like enzyme